MTPYIFHIKYMYLHTCTVLGDHRFLYSLTKCYTKTCKIDLIGEVSQDSNSQNCSVPPRVVDRRSSLDGGGGLSVYNTESLIMDHSGQNALRVSCSLYPKDLISTFRFDFDLDFWCLAPLSTILQLYHGDQF